MLWDKIMKREYYAGMSIKEQDKIWDAILESEKLSWKTWAIIIISQIVFWGGMVLYIALTN